jgi:hypothetical protein
MLTGRHPFHSIDQVSLMQMHLRALPPKPSQLASVPDGLDAVIRKAMAKKSEERHDTAQEFLRDVNAALARHARAESGFDSSASDSQVWAIYVDVRDRGGGPIDEDVLLDFLDVVDCAAYELRETGWQIAMQTDHTLLAVALTTRGPATGQRLDHEHDRAWLLLSARRLQAALRDRSNAHERTHVNICLHTCGAVLEAHDEGYDIVGGDVMDVDKWVPHESLHGIHATLQVMGQIAPGSSAPVCYVRVDQNRDS